MGRRAEYMPDIEPYLYVAQLFTLLEIYLSANKRKIDNEKMKKYTVRLMNIS